jgi:thiol-disulfide isomerase/thioredoxin
MAPARWGRRAGRPAGGRSSHEPDNLLLSERIMRGRPFGFLVGFLVVASAVVYLWSQRGDHAEPSPHAPPRSEATATAPPAARAKASSAPPSKLHVLAINGGGSPRENYLSHLQHLQGLVDLLHEAGVSSDHITVLAGDGSDPTPDLAVRIEAIGAEYWRLRGTAVDGRFLPRLELGNSAVNGATLYPATRGSLAIWMLTVGQQLRAGDTLLLYVTDHGARGATPEENRIVLWGAGQGATVAELRETLATLDPAVRVVALMSQCFSGAFADLLSLDGAPGGTTSRFCGYFSTGERERSYGCYPQTRDDPKVGHSFAFLQALPAVAGRLRLAHELVVERDDTPDQPLRTSDIYLGRVLATAAREQQTTPRDLTDGLLHAAWARPGRFDHQAQHLDRMAGRYGLPSPRTLTTVEEARARLQGWKARLDEATKRLGLTLEEQNRDELRRFLAARPQWQATLKPPASKAMGPDASLAQGAALVTELLAFARADGGGQTQAAAKAMLDANEQLVFRLTVRLAALERMALVLDAVAGEQLLDGHPAGRAPFDRLSACEDLALPVPKTEWPAPAPLPALADDLAQAEMILALTSVEDRARPVGVRLGEALPDLDLVPYRGELPSIGGGKPLLLFFWATWCKPCKEILPELMAVSRRRNLDVLAVAHETVADLDRFFAVARDFPALVARDPEARLASRIGLRAIPSFVLLDGQGKAASRIIHSPRELPGTDGE